MDEDAIDTLNISDTPDRNEVMETPATDDIGSDEDESFRTCEHIASDDDNNLSPNQNDDSEASEIDGDSDMFLSDDNDADIGGADRERDTEDEGRVETSFQRELLDYLGSLFNSNSRIRSTVNRQPLTITNDQLNEYNNLRDKVDSEMKILGVKSMTNTCSSDQSIARNLYYLLAARERGDWGSRRRYMRAVPMWTFETNVEHGGSCGSRKPSLNMSDGLLWRTENDEKANVIVEKSISLDRKIEFAVADDKESALSTDDMLEKKFLDRGAQLWDREDHGEDEGVTSSEIQSGPAVVSDHEFRGPIMNDNIHALSAPRDTKKKRNLRKCMDDDEGSEEVLLDGHLDYKTDCRDSRVEVLTKNFWNTSKIGKLEVEEDTKTVGVSSVLGQVSRTNLSDIKSAIYGSRWAVRRLGLEKRFPVHEGCVNALHFSGSGDWIASGSDDRKVVITDWQRDKQVSRFAVGHSSNIFQVRFMPGSDDLELVTCSRDKSVRYAALSSTGQLQYSRILHKHTDCCHKLDMPLDQPSLVMSAGEDGKVLWSDVRSAKSSGKICSVDKVALYSISCNPVRSQEFCVAGKDNNVYVFDRRKASSWVHQISADQLSNRTRGAYHVTSVVYSGDGNSVLASYNDEDIYLLSARPGHGPMTQHKYVGHRNVQTVTGVAFYGPNQEYVVSGSNDGHLLIWERDTEALVHWLLADEAGVVNVLEAHPSMPVLATSGLDHDVKLWSMLAADQLSPRVIPGDEDLLDRDQETSRIDLAWSTLSPSSQGASQVPPPSLPFNLRNLQLVTALNWKLRSDSHPYSFDNTLENLIFMSRRHGNTQLSTLLSSDSEESTDTVPLATGGVAPDSTDGGSGAPSRDQDFDGSASRPDGCRSS